MAEASAESRPDRDEVSRLTALNAILRIAARHESLLAKAAFDALAEALGNFVSFGRMAVVVTEGSDRRLYATSRGADPAIVPFGARFSVSDHPSDRLLVDGSTAYVCDDTRLGHEMDRRTAEGGLLSYVALAIPAHLGAGTPGNAKLIFAFREVGAASKAPIPLLQDVASIIGQSFGRSLSLARDRRLAMILDTSGDAMLAWDADGRITDANGAAHTLTGIPREELIGATIHDLLGPLTDRGGAEATLHGGVRMELAARDPKTHEPRRIIVSATVTAVEDDPLVAAHALLRDKSHVVAAERETALHLARVRELEQELRTLLDNAPLIIFRLDPKSGELRYLNRHAERLLGVPTAEALSTPGFLRAAHAEADAASAFDSAVECARLGAVSAPYEARLRWGGGAEITVRGTVYPLLSERGEVAAIEGILADVSTEHAARTRLVQADRLSTLGTLAAGVAHEINNPAAFILLGLDMLGRLLTSPGVEMDERVGTSTTDLVRELRDSIRRIVDIARDLRLFASPPSPESGRATVVDVNRTVESALTLTRGQIIERAQIVQNLGEVPPVLMDDGRLGQVLVNLLVNAAQAMPKAYGPNHTVTVATRSDGRVVEIEVTDTGVGISEENLPRIWTPFFTTKTSDVGTGLGLSISREIVERVGGTIEVESPTGPHGHGARFVITLPAAGRRDTITPISSPLPRIPTHRARVLIVEDEPALARALGDEIGQVHDVLVAEGAEEALRLLDQQSFDVVLCDLRMPGMSGEALYARVRARDERHARAFIFMTGVGFGADVERFLASSGRPLLEKPFPTERALAAIAKVSAQARVAS